MRGGDYECQCPGWLEGNQCQTGRCGGYVDTTTVDWTTVEKASIPSPGYNGLNYYYGG